MTGTSEFTPSLVSVLVTTYNVAEFLQAALEGIAVQHYRPIEVIAYDDASSDDSVAMLEGFRSAHEGDFEVQILSGAENIGQYRGLKQALRLARGEFVAVLDGDDVWLPGKLEAQVAWFGGDHRRVLCGHDVECFESATGTVLWTVSGLGRLRSGSGAAHSVRNGPIYPTSSVMLRTAAIGRDFNRLDLRRFTDWQLWSECLAQGGGYGYALGVYSRYRRNPRGDVARVAASEALSLRELEDGLAWLGWFEARYPAYHRECAFRRATLLANRGRVVFEAGQPAAARPYLQSAIGQQLATSWKPLGLLAMTWLPRGLSAGGYRLINQLRLWTRTAIQLRHRRA